MGLKLMYITNNTEIARIAQEAGVDRIFVDLEILGKVERQGHLDTVISKHSIEDVSKIKSVIEDSKLLVRVNPINPNSKKEINEVIKRGADIVMLPMFKSKIEVENFIRYVDGRAKVCLLLETKEAVENLEDILSVKGIDEIHIGLNDLHLSYEKRFMFELLSEGLVEELCCEFKKRGIKYGFGGIARLGQGVIPAEYIISEHKRLGSSMVILSRSFCDAKKVSIYKLKENFKSEVIKIRDYEKSLLIQSKEEQRKNIEDIFEIVKKIVEELRCEVV